MDGIRAILKDSLARSLRSMQDEDRLSAAWTVACGRALSERGRVVGYSNGIVEIEVADGAWMRQMISMREKLESDLSQIAGVSVAGIHFELKKP
jgi:Dna[CI] antecedent DciA-like protein